MSTLINHPRAAAPTGSVTASGTFIPGSPPCQRSPRPNKQDLEARLSHAYVRATHRRLMQTLGYGTPPPRRAFSPTVAQLEAFNPIFDAPSPSMLPTPHFGSPIPRRGAPGTLARRSSLEFSPPGNFSPASRAADSPVYPGRGSQAQGSFRRTPGAPLVAKGAEEHVSYFHLPQNVYIPAPPPALVGLGISTPDISSEQFFPFAS